MWQRILINLALRKLGLEPEKVIERVIAQVYNQQETRTYELGEAIGALAREQSRVRQSAGKLRRAYDALGTSVETTQ